jgi:hypothetical protein
MTEDPTLALLRQARKVLDRYLFDESDHCRDDVAEICQKIDDVILPAPPRVDARRLEETAAAA